jgi:histone H3/H4
MADVGKPTFRVQATALHAFQEATEAFLVGYFEGIFYTVS